MNCSRCGQAIPKGKSQCPACRYWNNASTPTLSGSKDESVLLKDVVSVPENRISTGPWDEVFGGGLTKGSVNMIGGAPGAGKSTLILQMCEGAPVTTLYVSAEEPVIAIKDRAQRLGLGKGMTSVRMLPAMTGSVNLAGVIETHKPGMLILDSLQGFCGDDDKIQHEVLAYLKKTAMIQMMVILVISHINKGDDFAGRMSNQHDVDALITLFPDEAGTRILECVKNRNGPAFKPQCYEMTEKGLVFVDKPTAGNVSYGEV